MKGYRKNEGKNRRKRFAAAGKLIAIVIFITFGLTGCAGTGQTGEYRRADTAMGTIISQTLYVKGDGAAVGDGIMELVRSLEEDTLSWRLETSELYRVNAGAGDPEGTAVSDRLAAILDKVLAVARDSGGALDVTIGEVTGLWDIDDWAAGEQEGDFVLPDQAALTEALSRSGYEKVALNGGRVYLPEGTSLDLGAVGKGAACSEIGDYLSAREEITGAVISAGGNIVTYGKKPDGTPWRIGVANPREDGANLGYLTLEGLWFVSTTGDYERYVTVDGVRYHHVMDPHTGYPARSGVISATILTRDGLLGDALSTACFVLGAEKGCALAEKYGVEALMVNEAGELVMTDGMKAYFHLS